jgi:alpha,alpha-trehalose phosphorylase
VIADTAPLHTAAWKRLADEEGLPFGDAEAQALRGLSRDDSLRRLLKGRTIPPGQFDEWTRRKNDYYLANLQSITRKNCLPGLIRFLAELKSRNIRLAAVSASRNARKVLEQVGATERFEVIIDGNDEARATTGLHRYHLAAASLRTAPQRCVVVEDSSAGIALARSAGMKTIGLGDPQRLCAADVALPSFEMAHVNDLLSYFSKSRSD